MQSYTDCAERIATQLCDCRWRGATKVSGTLTLCYDEWQALWRGGAYYVAYVVLGTVNHGEHALTESFTQISDLETWVTKHFHVDPENLLMTLQEFKMNVVAAKLAVS